MISNPVIDTDAYKITHWKQRPEGVTKFYNYGEPRLGGQHDEICFFGLQYIIKEYFMKSITKEDIEKGEQICRGVFGYGEYFPKEIWEKVRQLGYFPLKIKTVKEGTVLPTSNVCFTCESTEPWFADMVSHFEDYLMWCWYSTAVATRTFNIKLGIAPSFEKSSDFVNLDYAVNDFGLRGGAFKEAAAIGGMGHLVNFRGTDNIPAIYNMDHYYGETIGESVWATEHSVATVWGKDREIDYVKAQLLRSDPNSTVSIVIDSYDSDNFIKNVIGHPEIKQIIMARPGRVVCRPDSGEPLRNVVKYSEMLGDIFGYSINQKGYKVIKENVGIIQGDGMTETSIPSLYSEYIKTGWSASNVITGSGGGLLTEGLTRDTDRWAIKASYVEINGEPVDVRKTPKTDMTKQSKSGLLKLHKSGHAFSTISSTKDGIDNHYTDELVTIFENGELKFDQKFSDVRETARKAFERRKALNELK